MNDKMSRRDFLKSVLGASIYFLTGCSKELFQKRFQEMSPEEIKQMLKQLQAEYRKKYGININVKATPAIKGVIFGYALDLSKCIGCRRCVYACVSENNLSRNVQIHWIRVLKLKKGVFNLEKSEHYYNPKIVPETGYFYIPVQCQQCENPPCVKVCPVKATWKEPDGVIVIDYNWCSGCRICMAACPYRARKFNWREPLLLKDQINTETHYLGNRPRMKGVVEKCTFCIQRTRQGLYPACVEVCPVGARKFGNLLDPRSEIRYIFDNFRVFRLKENLNTNGKFYYYFSLGWR